MAKRTSTLGALAMGLGVTMALGAGGATRAEPASGLVDAVKAGTLILDARARYEGVDQDRFAETAGALTLRTRLGWETGKWNNLKALVEFEDVHALGGERFNSTLNGKTAYPVVADPDVTELNRAQIAWPPSRNFAATIGRQTVAIGDQRFIGSSAWRQDQQTFDAVRADVIQGPFSASYIYIDRVNRVFAEAQDWDSDSHVVNAAYAVAKPLRIEGFLYALDFRQSPANSSRTYGLRATGVLDTAPVALSYAATYANQRDYRGNTGDFSLDYWSAELSGTWDVFTLKGNYEVLDGNGVRGFATPLASLHPFQGWADVFLTTPANGIKDANLALAIKPKLKLGPLSNIVLTGAYHDFKVQRGGGALGSEVDIQISTAITKQLSAMIKFADYDGVPGFPSRQKVWLGLEFKL
jgi:hypothetical protein